MAINTDIVLELDRVSRLYPRDVSDMPAAILREMLLPKRWLAKAEPDTFYALNLVSLVLREGQKLGVIGAHRSGKSSLAGIASGLFLPTSGKVTSRGNGLLINRPTAGYKPTLTLNENLRLRASLAGLHGDRLNEVLSRTLSLCRLDKAAADHPMGNFSPFVVKQLGLTLLLQLPADLLVVDEVSSAGVGDERWQTRGLLQEKIEASTALVISSDFGFVQEVADDAVLLHRGRLYGPFSVEKAIEHFGELPQEDCMVTTRLNEYDPSTPPKSSPLSSAQLINRYSDDDALNGQPSFDLSDDDDQSDSSLNVRSEVKKMWSPVAKLVQISVDGVPYAHASSSLIRNPFDVLNLELTMRFEQSCVVSEVAFGLHPDFGEELVYTQSLLRNQSFVAGSTYSLRFSMEIPDVPINSYGLSMTPIKAGVPKALKDRLKVLKFGLQGEGDRHQELKINISDILINTQE